MTGAAGERRKRKKLPADDHHLRKCETFEPVTLGQIRGHGCRDLLVYCRSINCSHSATLRPITCRTRRRSGCSVPYGLLAVRSSPRRQSGQIGRRTPTSVRLFRPILFRLPPNRHARRILRLEPIRTSGPSDSFPKNRRLGVRRQILVPPPAKTGKCHEATIHSHWRLPPSIHR